MNIYYTYAYIYIFSYITAGLGALFILSMLQMRNERKEKHASLSKFIGLVSSRRFEPTQDYWLYSNTMGLPVREKME